MLKNLKPSVVISTLRTHKKKSIFGICALSYLTYYFDNKRKHNQLFTNYCKVSKTFGDEPVTHSPCQKITVLLNEFAKNGKCKYDFEKYALPLLHLAGLEVEIIKPQDEQQLSNIASVIDSQDTDIVYIVGGDGTVSKVVNGLMQHLKSSDDKNNKTSKISNNLPPIAVFPGGLENFFVKQIFPQDRSIIKWYCDNAMAIIKGHYSKRSVFEVEIDDKEPFFAAQLLHMGSFWDAEEKKFKYWYLGKLKRSFSYLWQALRFEPEAYDVTLKYVSPCSGCSKCHQKEKRNENKRWWHAFLGRPSQPSPSDDIVDYSKLINEDCGHVIESQLKSVEIFADIDKSENFQNLLINLGPETLSRYEFVSEGLKRNQHKESGFTPSSDFTRGSFIARELSINLNSHDEQEQKTPKKIGIDGNIYEFVDQIKLKVVPDAIKFFCYDL